MQRGNCTFKEKILKAASFNATAVLIYNNFTEKTVMMGHEGLALARLSRVPVTLVPSQSKVLLETAWGAGPT